MNSISYKIFITVLSISAIHHGQAADLSKFESCLDSSNNNDSSAIIANCEKALITSSKNDTIEILFALIDAYHRQDNTKQQDYYLSKISKHENYTTKILFEYLWNRKKGKRYLRSGDILQAKKHFERALDLSISENNLSWKSKSYNDVGVIAKRENNFKNALKYYQQSLLLKKQQKSVIPIAKTLTNIGTIYIKLEEYQKGLDYYDEANTHYLSLLSENPNDAKIYRFLSHLYEYYVNAYVEMDNTKMASTYTAKILSSFESKLSARQKSRALINIASAFNKKQQSSDAQTFLERAVSLEQLDSFDHSAAINYQIALMHKNNQKTQAAISYAKKSLNFSLESDWLQRASTHKLLSELYRGHNNDLALTNLSLYQKNREQLLKQKYNSDVKTLQHKIESQRINSQLTAEQLDNVRNKSKFQTLANWFLLIIILLFVSVSFIVYFNKKRKHEKETLLKTIEYHKRQLLLLDNSSENTGKDTNIRGDQANCKNQLKQMLVESMIDCLNAWEQHTETNRIELAEKSKIWTVSIDNGTLRTRSLDKYLTIEKIPNNPKWRNVIRTCHFVLSDVTLDSHNRKIINIRLESIMKHVKKLSLDRKK